MHIDKDATYLRIDDNSEGAILVDMVTEQVVRKFNNQWQPLPNGRILELANHTVYEAAPADCNWSTITSQQICLILYALMQYHEGKPLILADPTNESLRILFASLDDHMQEYVARACKITF